MSDQLRAGDEAYRLIKELYPVCRSITGDGIRQTLARLSEIVPLQIHEIPSGTQVLDWQIPDEWNIRDAWINDSAGNRVVDFRRHNLHVVNYSEPIDRTLSREELLPHLHSLPDHPDWIPYRTSYYDRNWGFCVTQRQRDALQDDQYHVCIDSTLEPGNLTYGEIRLPGESEREVMISAHACHPSLCNDNLSGVAVAILLARELSSRPRRLTYRFLFAPGTIGAIAWLAKNRDQLSSIACGVTLTCLGDASPFTYKRSLAGDSPLDRTAARMLAAAGKENQCVDFFPYGYDERQFNSPGFRLPFGSLMRARHGQFDEYHTSGDNLGFVHADHLDESFQLLNQVTESLEADRYYESREPEGEPQLGRRGVIDAIGDDAELRMAVLWVLNLSDGTRTPADMSERAQVPVAVIQRAIEILLQFELLAEASC